MKDIILFHPPVNFHQGAPQVIELGSPPLGLIYLASYLEKYTKNFRAHVIDMGAEKITLTEAGRIIQSMEPFAIGISVITPQLQGALELAQFIKKNVSKKIPIFAGGTHITPDPDFINRHPGLFDYAVTGEAEQTFTQSLLDLAAGKDLPQIQQGEPLMDIDMVPPPESVPKFYRRELYWRVHHIQASRSCPFNCYFCSSPAIYKKMRYHSIQRVVDQLKSGRKFYRGRVKFFDENFTVNRERVLQLCSAIKKEKLNLSWFNLARIDIVDFEVLKALKEAGCYMAAFGIESANEKLRREVINKGTFTNEDVYQVDEWCKKLGIKLGAYFMIGHPTETEEMVKETREMIFKMNIDTLALSVPTPYPGSKLFEIAEKEGIISKEILDRFARKELGEGCAGVYPLYISPTLEKKFIVQQLKEIQRKFYLRFNVFWSRLIRDISYPDELLTDAKYLYHLVTKGSSYQRTYIGYKEE